MLTMKWFFSPIDLAARGFIGICGIIDGIAFRLVSVLFQLFFSLAEVQLLSNSVYEAIADRVYLFVGVIALFAVTVSLLKALVNPDEINKGVIKSFKALVTSLALLILMPTIFEYAYSFQKAIISDNIIGKIFQIDLGNDANEGSMFEMCTFDDDTKIVTVKDSSGRAVTGETKISKNRCQANYITMNILEAFITPVNDDVRNNNGTTWGEARDYMIYTGNFNYVSTFVDQMYDAEPDESISYNFVISTIAAGILIYIVLSFCIDLGVRAAKLAFYQLISPIPVLMKMIPGKEGQFDKWSNTTISTFLEVFVRLLIIHFIIFMTGNLFEILDSLEGFDEVNLMGKAVLGIGLLLFAKQAPKLLSDALGFEAGNMKFRIKSKLDDISYATKFGRGAAGAVGTAALSGTRNLVHGIQNVKKADNFKDGFKESWRTLGSTAAGGVSGLVRGAKAGYGTSKITEVGGAISKSSDATSEKRNKREAYRVSHGDNIKGVIQGHISDAWHDALRTLEVDASTDALKKELDISTEAFGFKEALEAIASRKSDMVKLLNKQIDALNESAIRKEDFIKEVKRQDYKTDDEYNNALAARDAQAEADYKKAIRDRADTIERLKRAKNFETAKKVSELISSENSEIMEVVNKVDTFKKQHANNPAVAQLESLVKNTGWDSSWDSIDALSLDKDTWESMEKSITYLSNHETAKVSKNETAKKYAERIRNDSESK